MENVRDWCISRQLWWGHRIPAYYCDDCGEMTISKTDVTVCPKCASKNIRQEEDVLDTWFSSALWPFSTLGWPDKTDDLDYFYPTSVLVTGYDIIFFWVARMMFSGLEHTGKAPFKHVLIHGLVRDSQGRKMSKSLGNGIDPLEVIDKFGADALRFTLATGNAPGNDMRFHYERVESSRNFANKVWNAARFILMYATSKNVDDYNIDISTLADEDKWILHKFNALVKDVTDNLDKFEIGLALQKVYDFIYDSFCDWYIELVKPRLYEGGDTAKKALSVLVSVFSQTLKMLHPFMPFITEEIWQSMPTKDESIMISRFPRYDDSLVFENECTKIENIMESIVAIRNRRAEMNVPMSKKAKLYIDSRIDGGFDSSEKFYQKLAGASEVEFGKCTADNAVKIVTLSADFYIPFEDLVNIEQERARLEKELKNANDELARVKSKLANEGFVAKAPAKLIEAEKEKLVKYETLVKTLTESLEKL